MNPAAATVRHEEIRKSRGEEQSRLFRHSNVDAAVDARFGIQDDVTFRRAAGAHDRPDFFAERQVGIAAEILLRTFLPRLRGKREEWRKPFASGVPEFGVCAFPAAVIVVQPAVESAELEVIGRRFPGWRGICLGNGSLLRHHACPSAGSVLRRNTRRRRQNQNANRAHPP